MTIVNINNLHPDAIGLCLHKHNAKDELLACELVTFTRGRPALITTLTRAALSGRVVVEPFDSALMDFFADVYISEDEWVQSILLDKDSYRALKNRWMRCNLVRTL